MLDIYEICAASQWELSRKIPVFFQRNFVGETGRQNSFLFE